MWDESQFTRHLEGFLKGKDFPGSFHTLTVFKNHSSNHYKKDLSQQSKKDESSFPKNTQSEEECFLDNLSFENENKPLSITL